MINKINRMRIGGLGKLSLIEYPGKLSCIVFTIGCNFRCPYCYNPQLVNETAERIPESHIFDFLEKRKGLLDAVMITGGEPLIQPDILEFSQRIKKKGFLVGLETNGANPKILEELIEKKIIDFVAMDIKAPLEKYEEIVGVKLDIRKIKKSIEIIMNSPIEYEFRTTCYPSLNEEDFQKIFQLIKGAKKYALQQFSPKKTLVKDTPKPYSEKFLQQLKEKAKKYFKEVDLRV